MDASYNRQNSQRKIRKKYEWQKKHSENKTGTEEKYKPVNISKKNVKKRYDTWK